MTQKVTFRITAAAAPYVGADKPREERLKAAAGKVALPPLDLLLLVYYLCHDHDPEVKQVAVATLRGLEVPFLREVLADRELHPRILDALVQLHGKKTELASLFAGHPMLSEKSASLIAANRVAAADQALPGSERPRAQTGPHDTEDLAPPGSTPDPEEPLDEEEYQSKYQMAQAMGVGEKIKMAMTGDKEWRTLLIKDTNKLVSSAAIKNPRMTESEVLTIAKSALQNDEIMRVICSNKEWIKNAQIRKALVMNSKTPLPHALRFVATLSEKELAQLAKSKNVNTAVASQARRLLMNKKESR